MPYVSCTRDVVSPVRTHRRCRHHKRSHLSRRNAMKPEGAAVRLLRKKRHSSVQPRRMHCEPRSKGNQGAAREPSPQKLRRVKAGSRPGTTWYKRRLESPGGATADHYRGRRSAVRVRPGTDGGSRAPHGATADHYRGRRSADSRPLPRRLPTVR